MLSHILKQILHKIVMDDMAKKSAIANNLRETIWKKMKQTGQVDKEYFPPTDNAPWGSIGNKRIGIDIPAIIEDPEETDREIDDAQRKKQIENWNNIKDLRDLPWKKTTPPDYVLQRDLEGDECAVTRQPTECVLPEEEVIDEMKKQK
jgi:hypothetical protein